MSTSRLQRIITKYRRDLATHQYQAEQELIRAYHAILAQIQPKLDRLYAEIQQKIDQGEEIPASWLYESNRLNALKQYIQTQFNHYGELAGMITARVQAQAVALGTTAGHELLQATVPVGYSWSFGLPSHAAIRDLIGATQAGSPLADLFRGFGVEAANRAGEALITGLALGYNPLKVAPLVEQALHIPQNRARVICRSEQLRAYRSANLETFKANDDVCDGWIWISALTRNTCAACIAMHGTFHRLSEEMPAHPNCFPAGTLVSGPSVVGSTTRWYEGEMIEIETVGGNFLSVTPNHPILTPQGWVAAGLLNEGGDIISRRLTQGPSTPINPDDYQVEAPIEQVAMSFGSALKMSSVAVPTSPEDFHGDGFGSQVHVIRTHSHLRDTLDLSLLQPQMQQSFCWRHMALSLLPGLSSEDETFNRLFNSGFGSVGSLSIAKMFFRSALIHHEPISRELISQGYAHLFQAQANNITGNSERLRDSILRFPLLISLADLIERQITTAQASLRDFLIALLPPFGGFSLNSNLPAFNSISQGDITLFQPLFKPRRSDMVFTGEGVYSLSQLISPYGLIYPIWYRIREALANIADSPTAG
ncbi:MAG TPA: phage minor head protein, partial [Nitrososphaera sp.]|nr:phage minor head protein [Nitrososphaera sp.]